MQTVALGWLMLQLTGSGIALGNVLALQYLPIFLGAFFAGSIVDRFEKRRILYVTQSTLAILALGLSILVFSGAVQVWMVYLFALLMGTASSVDNPTRQTFVHEMVGKDHLRNAVTLLSTIANTARAIGPLVAGLLIATVGIAFCFFMNALSFLAVLFVLVLIDADELRVPNKPRHSVKGYFLPSHYVHQAHQELLRILVTMFFVGTLSYEFPVSLPLLAQRVFRATLLHMHFYFLVWDLARYSADSILLAGGKSRCANSALQRFVLAQASALRLSCQPFFNISRHGLCWILFHRAYFDGRYHTAAGAEEFIRGRVMALWSMAIFGTTLFGAPQ
jgi:MFS family permease